MSDTGLASFYLPEKMAMFIPVFAVLERNTFGTPNARKRNLKHYLKRYIAPLFDSDCRKLRELLGDKAQLEAVKRSAYNALGLKRQGNSVAISPELMEDIDTFYDAGHSFFDWDFENLTATRYLSESERQGIEKLRKHLIREIKDMNSFILPPDE